MKYIKIIKAEFVKRLNRFVAICKLDGEEVHCHVKNTGRCSEILKEGAECYLEETTNPDRKYKYSLVTVKKAERLINIDSQAPNKAVLEFLQNGEFFDNIQNLKAEKTFNNSRFDFYFEHDGKKAFLEVKGVTLERDSAVFFPDAPTERGRKHLYELCECVKAGYEAYALFVVQMKNVSYFSPDSSRDPLFAEALRHAVSNGVRVLCYDCNVEKDEMNIADEVRVIL